MFDTRLSNDTGHRNILFAAILLVCLPVAAFLAYIWIYIIPGLSDGNLPPIAFDSAKWKDKTMVRSPVSVRIRMIDDLVSNYSLVGMSRGEIESLLGEPDAGLGWRDWDMVYYLGPERSMIQLDSEYLLLRLDEGERITEYKVTPG